MAGVLKSGKLDLTNSRPAGRDGAVARDGDFGGLGGHGDRPAGSTDGVTSLVDDLTLGREVKRPVTRVNRAARSVQRKKRIGAIQGKVSDLKALNSEEDGSVSITEEVTKLQQKAQQALVDTYSKLTPWQKTQVARHPDRPHSLDYVRALLEDFTPMAGDRYFAEDAAIMGGLARFRGRPIVFIGHEKGSDTEGRIKHNFGMARPEGYRKAVRLMDLADKFGLPVVTLIDTAGAYPGIGAEERGQAEAIARSTDRCLSLGVPLVAVVIGEGGSGGAVAIATANRVLMLEHAI